MADALRRHDRPFVELQALWLSVKAGKLPRRLAVLLDAADLHQRSDLGPAIRCSVAKSSWSALSPGISRLPDVPVSRLAARCRSLLCKPLGATYVVALNIREALVATGAGVAKRDLVGVSSIQGIEYPLLQVLQILGSFVRVHICLR